MAREPMTKAAYAALKGWSKAYLSKAEMIERLAPAMVEDANKPGRYLIDPDKADEIMNAAADPAREFVAEVEQGKKEPEQSTLPSQRYQDYRTERERINVENQLLDLEERKGNLISKKPTIDNIVKVAQKIRERLSSRNILLAGKVATMTDERLIAIEFEKSDRAILEALSNDLVRQLQMPDDHIPAARQAYLDGKGERHVGQLFSQYGKN